MEILGCIGDLGRYGARMGLLVFSGADTGNLKGLVTDVQSTRYELKDGGNPMVAECIVHFTDLRSSAESSDYTAIETDAILPFVSEKLMFTLVKQNLTQFDEIVTANTKVVECYKTWIRRCACGLTSMSGLE
eukprot:CCRYP_018187-RA/>CCRYP_018187-RA protein AED:0.89 eAED:0.89 QI:0/0/0/0.5/1/1/2/0/131